MHSHNSEQVKEETYIGQSPDDYMVDPAFRQADAEL
jgi:hypothetical protein